MEMMKDGAPENDPKGNCAAKREEIYGAPTRHPGWAMARTGLAYSIADWDGGVRGADTF